MSTSNRARIAMALMLTAAVACATSPRGLKGASGSPATPRNMLRAAEIQSVHVLTAYEAVQRLRPTFLTWTRAVTPSEQRVVIVDGVQVGGLDALRMIPADAIREVRLFTPMHDVGPYQLMSTAGAIVVTTRTGPRG